MNIQERRANLIRQRLTAALNPTYLNIADQSPEHEGHPGQQSSGGGHYRIEIISTSFSDKSAIERHRLVYLALGDAMASDIHAVSITAKTPSEMQRET